MKWTRLFMLLKFFLKLFINYFSLTLPISCREFFLSSFSPFCVSAAQHGPPFWLLSLLSARHTFPLISCGLWPARTTPPSFTVYEPGPDHCLPLFLFSSAVFRVRLLCFSLCFCFRCFRVWSLTDRAAALSTGAVLHPYGIVGGFCCALVICR